MEVIMVVKITNVMIYKMIVSIQSAIFVTLILHSFSSPPPKPTRTHHSLTPIPSICYSPLQHFLLSRPQSRPRNSVIRQRNIRIEINPRVSLLVKIHPQRPRRILRPRARDIDI